MAKILTIILNHYPRLNAASILSITALVSIAGCVANYGRLVRNQEINEVFNSYRFFPDYRYYFAGPEGRPDAIMGIHQDYTLETTQWTEIELTGTRLKKLVEWINFHHRSRTRNYPDGFLILDPKGKKIGIWYSIWDWTTVIVNEDKRVVIYTPLKDNRFGNGDERERKKLH